MLTCLTRYKAHLLALWIALAVIMLIGTLALSLLVNLSALYDLRMLSRKEAPDCAQSDAVSLAQSAADLFGDAPVFVIRRLGYAQFHCGDWVSAETAFEQLDQRHSISPLDIFRLAQISDQLSNPPHETVSLLRRIAYVSNWREASTEIRRLYLDNLLRLAVAKEQAASPEQSDILDSILSVAPDSLYAMSSQCRLSRECSLDGLDQARHFTAEQIADPRQASATARVIPWLVEHGVWSEEVAFAVVDYWLSRGLHDEASLVLNHLRCEPGQALRCLASWALCSKLGSCDESRQADLLEALSDQVVTPFVRDWFAVLASDGLLSSPGGMVPEMAVETGEDWDGQTAVRVLPGCEGGVARLENMRWSGLDDGLGKQTAAIKQLTNWRWDRWVGNPFFDDALYLGEVEFLPALSPISNTRWRVQGFWSLTSSDAPRARAPRAGWLVNDPVMILSDRIYVLTFCYRTQQTGEADPITRLHMQSENLDMTRRTLWLPPTHGSWSQYFLAFRLPGDTSIPVEPMVLLWSPGILWFANVEFIQVSDVPSQ